MYSKIALLGAVAALSLVAAGQSQAHHQGWYVGLEGGANWVDDNTFAYDTGNPPGGAPLAVREMEFDTGWAALGTVGYGFEKNWRVELELGYRQNDADFALPVGAAFPTNGELTEYTAMINVIYDVPLSERFDLNVGLGVGADYAQYNDDRIVDDADTNFAYQAIAGLTYKLTNRLDVSLTYRFLNVDSPNFADAVPGRGDTYAFDDVEKHTVTVGLRYDLFEDAAPYVAPPPAPPPAPPTEARQFIIYFGFNKCNISPEADTVLGEAASTAKTVGSASVVIVGHTDTVGSNAYNQKLSQCRANAAKTNLVAKGIGAGSISTSGRGEDELLVKTGDGVKEPQNRRATIDLN